MILTVWSWSDWPAEQCCRYWVWPCCCPTPKLMKAVHRVAAELMENPCSDWAFYVIFMSHPNLLKCQLLSSSNLTPWRQAAPLRDLVLNIPDMARMFLDAMFRCLDQVRTRSRAVVLNCEGRKGSNMRPGKKVFVIHFEIFILYIHIQTMQMVFQCFSYN